VQVFAVTPLPATIAMMTQIVTEEWTANNNPSAFMTQIATEEWTANNNPSVFMTQIALEQWASVAGVGSFSARHV
jgi:hypothetical protein